MKITLDEHGTLLPDASIESWIANKLAWNSDIHVANVTAINCVRAALHKMPVENRPKVQWFFYGEEVHFNNDLRSDDAWKNRLTELDSEFLMELL